uniref:Uncharacterized protein n=1 Tax=Arundo donax TaxID=35708 RepID=A0A0A9BJV2_ARUDO
MRTPLHRREEHAAPLAAAPPPATRRRRRRRRGPFKAGCSLSGGSCASASR